MPEADIGCPCAKVSLGIGGDDVRRWGAVGVAPGVLHDRPVLGVLGAEALQQCAHCRLIDFV